MALRNIRGWVLLAVLPVLAACGGGGSSDCKAALGSFADCSGTQQTPVVQDKVLVKGLTAVTEQFVDAVVKNKVELDGSNSLDANGYGLNYSWKWLKKPNNSNAVLSGASTPKPNFVPDVLGEYTLSFSVSDDKTSSPLVEIVVTAVAANVAPKASAGINREMLVGGELVLDASSSTDANGDALTYAWEIFDKPTASAKKDLLSASEGVKTFFVPDVVGTYRVRLVASDVVLKSDPVLVTITVSNKNLPPVADVTGSDSDGAVGTAVNLDGSASADPNDDALTYAWTTVYAPPGSIRNLLNIAAPIAKFLPDLPGLYVFSLVVTERFLSNPLSSLPVNVVVTVTAP
jgi:hypothetical protein